MKKFWKFARDAAGESELRLEGELASEESWWYDVVTPQAFREELAGHAGDITVWINSPGGDVSAGSAMYTALKEHKGRVTVKVDGMAASAASVVAMAGDEVLMSPTAQMMIHNPWTFAVGDARDMESAARMLDEAREAILNAYQAKTGRKREELAKLVDDETWMSAASAVEMGFADGVLYAEAEADAAPLPVSRATIYACAQSSFRRRTPTPEDKARRERILADCADIMIGL